MRKTFKFICAAVVAAFAVSSCYEDALVWDELDKHSGEIAGLAERVAALETKLNSEVAAINGTISALEGKVAAADEKLNKALTDLATRLDKKDAEIAADVKNVLSQVDALKKSAEESTVDAVLKALQDKDAALEKSLTDLAKKLGTDLEALSDELLAELAEALESVAVQKVEEKDGVVVVTLANGKTVSLATPDANANNTGLVTIVDGEWHVVLEDGTTKSLDVPVGVEEIEFQVNYKTYELEFSVNGGEFVGTGAYVAESYEYLVYGTAYEEDDYVTLTIGGVEYNLPKVSDASVVILAGKTYFVAGATKTFDIKVDGIKSAFVASAPKGWEADLDMAELELTVTAPAVGAGAEEGTVEVWLLTKEGTVITATVAVAVGDPVVGITVDSDTYEVEIVFNEVDGKTPEVIYGVLPAEEFTDEFVEGLIENLNQAETLTRAFTNLDPNTAKPVGTPVETTMTALVGADAINYNEEYIIWAVVPEWDDEWKPQNSSDDFYKEYVKMEVIKFTEGAKTPFDAEFSFKLTDPNVTSFRGFYMMAMEWEYGYKDMIMGNQEFVQMMAEQGAIGVNCVYEYDQANGFSGSLASFGWSQEMIDSYEEYDEPWGNMVMGEGVVIIIPLYDGKKYVYDDLIIKKVSALKPVLDDSATGSVTPGTKVEDYLSCSLEVAVTSPYVCIFEGDYTDEEIEEEFEYGAELIKVEEGKVILEPEYVTSGETYNFIIVTVDADGKAKIHRDGLSLTTKTLPYSEDLKVTVKMEVTGNQTVTPTTGMVMMTITGEADYLVYLLQDSQIYTSDDKSVLDVMNAYADHSSENNWGLSKWVVVDLSTVTLIDNADGSKTYTLTNQEFKSYTTKYAKCMAVATDGDVTFSKVAGTSCRYVQK